MKRKMNKTKRKMNKTKRKMNKTKRKMNIIREKRIRKRNKVNLHNKLMKGGSATGPRGEANLFGMRMPDVFFHDTPPPAEAGPPGRISKDPNFNIPNILTWLGISVSRFIMLICNLSTIVDPPGPTTADEQAPADGTGGAAADLPGGDAGGDAGDESSPPISHRFRQWISDKCAFRIINDIEFDIQRHNNGFNLIINYFNLTLFLELDPENRNRYLSPSIKFNIRDILISYLNSQGYGDYYNESRTGFVSVIQPFRFEDIIIRFEYEISVTDEDTYTGSLRLCLEQITTMRRDTLLIGTISYDTGELTREISVEARSEGE